MSVNSKNQKSQTILKIIYIVQKIQTLTFDEQFKSLVIYFWIMQKKAKSILSKTGFK